MPRIYQTLDSTAIYHSLRARGFQVAYWAHHVKARNFLEAGDTFNAGIYKVYEKEASDLGHHERIALNTILLDLGYRPNSVVEVAEHRWSVAVEGCPAKYLGGQIPQAMSPEERHAALDVCLASLS